MNQRRKQTAWKKNRRLGEIKGGRTQVKRNSVVRILHELKPPEAFDELPILIEDRPPSGHYWPLDVHELKAALDGLPASETKGLTHLWLRTPSTKMQRRHGQPLCSLTTGRGVRLIMLHPFPKDRTYRFGRTKPSDPIRREFERLEAVPYKKDRAWFATFTEKQLRRFYVEYLLYYLVGDHVFRWRNGFPDTGAAGKKNNSFAADFARKFRWKGE